MAELRRRTLKLPAKPVSANPEVPEEEGDPDDPLARQRRYVVEQSKKRGSFGLVFAEAFIRGMREIGYKNPAWALAELIDNSFQAGASTVDIRMHGVDWTHERSKPSQIAIVDDGIGMISKMIQHAVRWGGTDRENDRTGFGRYGYGLPSAAVSLARRYSVYSKTPGKKWYVVHVNLEELGKAASSGGKVDELLAPQLATLPPWLTSANRKLDAKSLKSGTIVVLEDLDRLHAMGGWISAKSLKMKLLQHFGVIYRHTLQNKKIFVADERTQVIDPLFLLPLARYADETKVVARPVKAGAFEMESSQGKGVVSIRAAVLPPNFQLADPSDYGKKGAELAQRHSIMRNYNGILVCRGGRQIDVVAPEWTRFQTYDANIKIEIDFDPTLDEFFGLTTSKQQIVIDERMWEKLKQTGKTSGGLQTLVKEMRQEFRRMRSELEATTPPSPGGEQPRPSVSAMQSAQKFKTRPSAMSPQKSSDAEKALKEFARIVAAEQAISVDEALATLRRETEQRPYKIEFQALEEAPMYLAKRLGLQKRLIINTAHPFYDKIYKAAGEAQAGLELMLFVLADAELDAEGDREEFYRNERFSWSESMRNGLEQLISDQTLTDRASAEAEEA